MRETETSYVRVSFDCTFVSAETQFWKNFENRRLFFSMKYEPKKYNWKKCTKVNEKQQNF